MSKNIQCLECSEEQMSCCSGTGQQTVSWRGWHLSRLLKSALDWKKKKWSWEISCWYPLEKGMATHSSILAWEILWTEESAGLQSKGLQRDTTERVTHVIRYAKNIKNSCKESLLMRSRHLNRTINRNLMQEDLVFSLFEMG